MVARPKQKPRTGGERSAGWESAKRLIGPRLPAPASADWPWEAVSSTPLHDSTRYKGWTVTGVVDVPNAAGTPVRHEWEVIVVLDKPGDRLFPIRVKLDNVIVWGTDRALEDLLTEG